MYRTLATLSLVTLAACGTAAQTVHAEQTPAPAAASAPDAAPSAPTAPAAPATATPARTYTARPLLPAPMAREAHCDNRSAEGYRVIYDLATNAQGDELHQVSVLDPNTGSVLASAARVFSGAFNAPQCDNANDIEQRQNPDSQNPNAGNPNYACNDPNVYRFPAQGGRNVMQVPMPGSGKFSGDGHSLTFTLDRRAVSLDIYSVAGIYTAHALAACTPIADGSLPTANGNTVHFGRMAYEYECSNTWDATAGNYVDLSYRLEVDDQGQTFAAGTVASRVQGGSHTQVANVDLAKVPDTTLTAGINMLSRSTAGTFGMALDANATWTATYTDAAQGLTQDGNAVSRTIAQQACDGWLVPRRLLR